ncbi:MAG TPA: UvrD-helicase domain-containing protein, partial [Myxococcota bacterium]|nr:UvrD-helicase domain-containing protein [Myxococcota bacterium]
MSTAAAVEVQRAADARARARAQREFAAPLAIEAGAGTGKTAVLVARVVAWCLGEGWERAEERLRAAPRAGAP